MLQVAIMILQCIATQKYYMINMPESDVVLSLITNSKILLYTVQRVLFYKNVFKHWTKYCSDWYT